jgi:putative transposase
MPTWPQLSDAVARVPDVIGTIARLHRHVRNRRHNYLHGLSTGLIREAGAIGIETLGLAGLFRSGLGLSFADAALGELVRQLAYKAGWHGRHIVKIGRFERSTGCCPDCGLIGPRLARNVRRWRCACGAEHDRDIAAARWIALRAREKLGRGTPEVTRGESHRPLRRGLGLRRKPARRTAYSPRARDGPPAR